MKKKVYKITDLKGNDPVPHSSGKGFFIGEDGNVHEFVWQSFANFAFMERREDLIYKKEK